jgi:hypothetical protein
MQRRELEAKADAIEMVLHEHKAPARVTGGHVTPRWVQFLLQTSPGVKISRVESLSREIAVALGAPNARVTTQGNAVRIEVPRSDPQPLKLFALCMRIPPARIPFGTAVLGLADDGAPLLIRMPSPEVAHVLVSGTTGSGKTALMQTIIMSLALLNHRRQLQFVLIDPKGRAFEPMSRLPHLLRPIVTGPDQAVQALSDPVNLMEQRDQSRVTDPRVIVAIDGFSPTSFRPVVRISSTAWRAGAAWPRGGNSRHWCNTETVEFDHWAVGESEFSSEVGGACGERRGCARRGRSGWYGSREIDGTWRFCRNLWARSDSISSGLSGGF